MAVNLGAWEGICTYLPANGIKDNINPFAVRKSEGPIHEILLFIVNAMIRSQGTGKLGLFMAADGRQNNRAGVFGYLDGDISNSAGSTVN